MEDNLKLEVETLTRLFKKHKHLGTDLTQKLETATTTQTYGGKVLDTGAAGNLPAGWTSSKSGGNVYTITHNLNNAVYAVVAMAENANVPVMFFTPGLNSFTIEFDTGVGVATATLFRFVLTLIK
jgi:hypothetical protein